MKSELFKALADDTRLCILKKLMDGEKKACQIIPCEQKSQPTVSLHLKVLLNAEIIDFRKVGKERLYNIKNKKIIEIMKILEG